MSYIDKIVWVVLIILILFVAGMLMLGVYESGCKTEIAREYCKSINAYYDSGHLGIYTCIKGREVINFALTEEEYKSCTIILKEIG